MIFYLYDSGHTIHFHIYLLGPTQTGRASKAFQTHLLQYLLCLKPEPSLSPFYKPSKWCERQLYSWPEGRCSPTQGLLCLTRVSPVPQPTKSK